MKKFLRNCLIAALMVVFAGLFACGEEASPEHKHEFGEWTVNKQATCTEKGEEKRICACGESELRETAAKGHMFGEWTVEIQPGENQDGKKSQNVFRMRIRTIRKNSGGRRRKSSGRKKYN